MASNIVRFGLGIWATKEWYLEARAVEKADDHREDEARREYDMLNAMTGRSFEDYYNIF